jgi:hypothetical protein
MYRPEDQLTTALRNMLRKYLQWFSVVSVLLVFVTGLLAVLWYRNPTGNYEPLIGVIVAITSLLGVPSLREWRANGSSELHAASATQLANATKAVPSQAASIEQANPWIAMRSIRATWPDRKIGVFSVSVSTVLFMFGTILQPAVQRLVEPENLNWKTMEICREHAPEFLLVTLLTAGVLPGIVTGLLCASGRSLNRRISLAIVSTIVSLSIFDSIFFFSLRRLLLESEIPEIRTLAHFGNYYFALLSNLFGGAAAGLIVGSATHLFAGVLSGEPQNASLSEELHNR